MMKGSTIVLAALMALLCAVACANNKEVAGSWLCAIGNGETRGTDTITFACDSSFSDRQTLLYTTTDSGFAVRARFSVSIDGRWSVRGDSIYVSYRLDTYRFTFHEPSFAVTASGANADTTALASVRGEMSDRLAGHLQSTYRAGYGAVADREICLGRITRLDADALVIEKAGVTLPLTRLH